MGRLASLESVVVRASVPPVGPGVVIEGRYRIELVLSINPNNDGYLATDLMKGHSVFMKTLQIPELVYRVAQLRQLFQDASLVAAMQRGDFVPLLGFGVDPQLPGLYLVMGHRADVPPPALLTPGGPEMRTAAAFSELALGMLHNYDQYSGAPPVVQPPPRMSARQARKARRRQESLTGRSGGWRTRFTGRELAITILLAFGVVVLVTTATEDRPMMREARDHLPTWMLRPDGGKRRRGPASLQDEVPKARSGGRITIDSIPSGARVTAGARDLGVTPVRIARPAATLNVVVSLDGYNDHRLQLGPQAASRLRVNLVAARNFGRSQGSSGRAPADGSGAFEGRTGRAPGTGFDTGLPNWTNTQPERDREREEDK